MSGVERIGVNMLFMQPDRGGREVAGRQLIRAIRCESPGTEIVTYAGRSTIAELARDEVWSEGISLSSAPVGVAMPPVRIGTELAWLPGRARRDRVQLVHSLGNTAPTRSSVPSLITIHDLHYHRYPEIQDRRTRVGLQILVRAAARRASRIVCPSLATKADIVEILGIDPGRVDVVPHGPGRECTSPLPERELRSRHRLGDAPVVFCPAVGFAYKNLERLLRAFAQLPDREVILVHTGWPAREGERLRLRARELGIDDRVRWLGWVDDATIESLYAHSRLIVQPSLSEGFGLPVLEAMRRGLPVACSSVSSLGEIAGDAAETFDPYDVDAIAGAVERLLSDGERREDLIRRGKRQAAGFSWQRAARETLAVYRRAIEESSVTHLGQLPQPASLASPDSAPLH